MKNTNTTTPKEKWTVHIDYGNNQTESRIVEITAKQMLYNIIAYGVFRGTFYVIQSHETHYSLWCIDEMPKGIDCETIEAFMLDHTNEGYSISGTYEQVMAEFANALMDIV